MSSASVAVLAGGVTLYEACALGVPAVAIALNQVQHATIRAIAQRGAAVDAGLVHSGAGRTIARVAREVDRLLRDPALRRRMAAAGRRLVDARGARPGGPTAAKPAGRGRSAVGGRPWSRRR